jgi:uncharacterized protein involved in exopolysaccharide biosynthesis
MTSERFYESQPQTGQLTLSLSEVVRIVLSRWKFVFCFALGTAICTAIIILFVPNKYTATATILPASSDFGTKGMSSIAEEIPTLEAIGRSFGERSPSILYPEILKSRLLAEDIIRKSYSIMKKGKTVTFNLYRYFKTDNPDIAYKDLQKITAIDYDKKTGIVSVSATTTEAQLSAQIANHYVQRLDEFNKYQRKTGAGLNREFIKMRMAETEKQLKQAEENLKLFREKNLNYYRSTDPELLMVHDRLFREVDVKTEVYLTLAQQYELAIIQEKKELPVIQVLDTAKPPTLKSGPARAKTTFLGLLVGILMSSFLVVVQRKRPIKSSDIDIKRFIRKFRLVRRPQKIKNAEHIGQS